MDNGQWRFYGGGAWGHSRQNLGLRQAARCGICETESISTCCIGLMLLNSISNCCLAFENILAVVEIHLCNFKHLSLRLTILFDQKNTVGYTELAVTLQSSSRF